MPYFRRNQNEQQRNIGKEMADLKAKEAKIRAKRNRLDRKK